MEGILARALNNGQFNISGTQLRANASFDYEGIDGTTRQVRVLVTDSVGNTYTKDFTIDITNVTAQQQATLLITQINSLVADGVLNRGNGNALIVKLNAAISSLNNGNTTAGVNQLNAFINQLNAFKKTGKLTDAMAQYLIDGTEEVIAEV